MHSAKPGAANTLCWLHVYRFELYDEDHRQLAIYNTTFDTPSHVGNLEVFAACRECKLPVDVVVASFVAFSGEATQRRKSREEFWK